MSNAQESLTFTQDVAREPKDVFAAFTTAGDVCDWLCHDAQVEAVVGGRIYLYWAQGYYASGHFTALVPNEKIRFVWYGKDEPGVTEVDVQFEAIDGGTRVTLIHDGVGEDEAWEQTRKELKVGWEFGLENLKAVLETGLDKRIYDRPVLGLVAGVMVTAAQAEALGLPVAGGILLNGTVPGTGAAEAGLQANDLVYKIEGVRIQSPDDLIRAVANYRVGETVRVLYVRNGEAEKAMMKLSARPAPHVPSTPYSFSQLLEEINMELAAELMEILEGVTDEMAETVTTPGSWSLKQILAHLVGTERVVQVGIALHISEGGPASFIRFPDNLPAWIDSIVASHDTLVRLVGMWQGAKRETAILVRNLPPELVARKADYMGLAGLLLQSIPRHTSNHFEDMRMVLKGIAAMERQQEV